MTDRLRIALAQMNQRVGDLEGNAAAMLEMRRRAADADLLLCPELQLIGYPPEDLVLKPEFVRRVHECTDELVAATIEPGPAMLIGTIVNEGGSELQRHAPRRRRHACSAEPSSTSCPITAPSTRSASSLPARCPSRSSSGA